MNFKPILFNTEMVQAILEDRKNQTRRTKGLENISSHATIIEPKSNPNKQGNWITKFKLSSNPDRFEITDVIKCPYEVGDVLWVRETCCPLQIVDVFDNEQILYRTDLKAETFIKEIGGNWKPSIFMPKHACRIFLKVKLIRAERLQDISEEDAIAEGLIQHEKKTDWLTAKFGFQIIWEKINGKESWKQNPFVWVIEFEQIEKPLDFI
jgi:hypothetical protein